MLSVTLNLDHMHCHEENDPGSGSEPYLWTVFFHADMNSITLGPGNRLVTYTPHSNWTTRGMYPNGVNAGDDVDIPEAIGNHTITLDDGGLGVGIAGMLFVLLEQDSTDGDAIKAGHQALAEATDEVLNNYVDSFFPEVPPEPTTDQIEEMADQIQAEVEDAIRDKIDWYEVLENQDDLLGFGYQFYFFDELALLASQSNSEQSFSTPIRKEVTWKPPFGLPITLVTEFEVFGSVQAQSLPRFLGPHVAEFADYEAAVKELKEVDSKIEDIIAQLREAKGGKRKVLLSQLEFQQRRVRPFAVKAIGSARAAYEASYNAYTADTKTYLEEKMRLRKSRAKRLSRTKPNPFRRTANIVPPRTVETVQKMRQSS